MPCVIILASLNNDSLHIIISVVKKCDYGYNSNLKFYRDKNDTLCHFIANVEQ